MKHYCNGASEHEHRRFILKTQRSQSLVCLVNLSPFVLFSVLFKYLDNPAVIPKEL